MQFSVSESAAARISEMTQGQPGAYVRVMVEGGGCSGFQYKFALESAPLAEDDVMIEKNGAKVAVDTTSLELMKDAELAYIDELGGASFQIRNPNASATCGCGNSFAVK